MKTVFPTPAPPNRPIFPPRLYGAHPSTTLMPVSKMDREVSKSTYAGDGRWIGNLRSVFTGPLVSTGSPRTLKILPKVHRPTGTVIEPGSICTGWPRYIPSVPCMATHRSVLSPNRCCTSHVTSPAFAAWETEPNLVASRVESDLVTSTTGPIIWATSSPHCP